MNAEDTRTCLVCGAQFPAAKEFCPVCMLREALGEQAEPAQSSLEERGPELTPRRPSHRFEHYELVIDKDRKPVELGRGAMGVTYKAFDVELRCPVTLKVINERYLGDESARLRFLREARAAAKVRHSNVASVLHLGRTRTGYFYAMEFVEGETVEHLIKRSGGLEVNLALEIVTQVAAGLVAIHKQKLVHRDIKPSNIMVNLEEGGAVTAKIIDLGLAKAVNEAGSQTAISTPGGFAGTPEFASPEQFAGVQVDIRSDLYSLGVTLWEMVTGKTPFRGTPAEVMHQHQHAALPIEQLEGVPQPIVVLLEMLLDKDPRRRFQNPAELVKVMPAITHAIEARRRITLQSLGKTSYSASRVGTRKLPAKPGPKKISVARLPVTGTDLFGREEDIAFLDDAWGNQHVNIVTIIAGLGSGSPRWSTIGSGGWQLKTTVPQSSFLAGLSTDKAPVGMLPRRMNFLTWLWSGLAMLTRDWERRGKRARDWRSSFRIVELYWFLTAWNRSKTLPVHKKDEYVSLLFRRFCASLLLSIGVFA